MSLPKSAALLHALEHAPTPFVLTAGVAHQVKFVNAAFRSTFGGIRTAEPLPAAFVGEARRALAAVLDRVLASGEQLAEDGLDLSDARRPGLPYDVVCIPWRDEAGATCGTLLTLADTAASLAARQAAQASEARLRALIEVMPQAIFVSSRTGQVLYANARWQQCTGLDPNTTIRADWRQKIVHPDDADKVAEAWHRAGETAHFEVVARLRDHATQAYRWQKLVGVPTYDFVQDSLTWVGSWTDIDDRVAADQQRLVAHEQFVAAFSHDLRGPLTAIRVSAESMLRQSLAEQQRAKLQRIIETVDRTDGMLETLLDVNLIRSTGQLPIRLEPTDLRAALAITCGEYTARYGSRLVTKMPESVKGTWHATSLIRAVDNLLSNAFKYGDSQTPVTLQVEQDVSSCRIRVHNEGTPIANQDRERIFRPYERLRLAAAQRGVAGWGLGLSLVDGVARAHGGSVEVLSTSANGTDFVIEVPNDSSEAHVSAPACAP